jgi:hypothetical protein
MNGEQVIGRKTLVGETASPEHNRPPWDIAAIEDFNLDGRADIVWVNSINGRCKSGLWTAHGSSTGRRCSRRAISPSATHRHGVSLESGTSMERRTLRVGRTEHWLPVF